VYPNSLGTVLVEEKTVLVIPVLSLPLYSVLVLALYFYIFVFFYVDDPLLFLLYYSSA
jgi:hypothetical protein